MYECQEDGDGEEDIDALKKIIKSEKNLRMKLRYDTILLYLRGYKKSNIASIFSISYYTVRNYVISYESEGIAGLSMGKSTGAKPKMTSKQEQELYECITMKLPKEVGFAPHANWTSPLACKWVEREFSIIYSERA